MGEVLNVTCQIKGLNEEIKKEVDNIEKHIPTALNYVGSEMAQDLRKHLHDDWYSKYAPTEYDRRTDDPSLGIPLADDQNFFINVNKKELRFTYEPTGEHKNRAWSQRYGDALIEFIQKGMEYDLTDDEDKEYSVPPRPFWNNFVNSQQNREIIDNFIAGMSPDYNVIKDASDDNLDLSSSLLEET
uniref:Phage protein n=1 Tax=Siphoviridae sp. ctnMR5 TaxID=2825658 RepID=A0A8S5U8U7_9CAUD|nr:MAG TPA: hypothetical protein [Siphoviridae sp. ctnMR5]